MSAASPSANERLIAEPVTVLIVNYRTAGLAARCVASLASEKAAFGDFRVMLVDGGSGDGSAEELAAFVDLPEFRDWVELLALRINGGFGWANNQAILRLMNGTEAPKYIHLLNPDAEIEPSAVSSLARYLNDNPRTAAVGSQLLELDGSLTGSAFSFPTLRGEFSRGARTGTFDRILRVPPVSVESAVPVEVDWATGASVMLRVEALRDVGLFDEGFFLYHEEIELMWRLRRAGWTIAFEPRSRVRHVGGGSTGVHSRQTPGPLAPRRPPYWYRSRSRYFALTRGRTTAMLAFLSWLAGHCAWHARRIAGLAPGAKPLDHQLRDHLVKGFPRAHDGVHASALPGIQTGEKPAWMINKWL